MESNNILINENVSDYIKIQEHINHAIVPEAHTPIYVWHKYWTRKPHNVVSEYIKTYAPEEGMIVLDPFSGSGVTTIEAIKLKRKAIAIDINPISMLILDLSLIIAGETGSDAIRDTFLEIEKKTRKKIEELYVTTCRNCKKEIVADCYIWEHDEPAEIRYKNCPYCGDKQEKNCGLNQKDKKLLKEIDARKIGYFYPAQKLYYSTGRPFKEKQRYEAIPDMFTKRNLLALSILMNEIEKTDDPVRKYLKGAFSSMVHLCSRMCPISEGGHFTPFSSAWVQHSYWYPSGPYMEQNVLNKYKSAILGPQGIARAQEETLNQSGFKASGSDIKARIERLLKSKKNEYPNFISITGSALDMLRKMPNSFVDYVFTDPPYDAAIQFGELTYMWACWLKLDSVYEELFKDEIVRNEKQNKNFDRYYDMLHVTFKEIFRVLKPGNYMTVTFHNPTNKVRNAVTRAIMYAGFNYEKIIYQPPVRPSAKSLLQPYGSAVGDFFLRFRKPVGSPFYPRQFRDADTDTEFRNFEKIVIETTKRVLAERGQPTPFSIINNTIDPELAKHGYVLKVKPEFTIENIIDKHLKEDLVLVDEPIGKIKGKMLWFRHIKEIHGLSTIPVTERVEKAVIELLVRNFKISFTDALKYLWEKFPNALTPDSQDVKDVLEIYAEKAGADLWRIKSGLLESYQDQHTVTLFILGQMGKKLGFKVWIGNRERSEKIPEKGLKESEKTTLGELSSTKELRLHSLGSISPEAKNSISNIDVLWHDGNNIQYAFEVEYTTMMTEALNRVSNIPYDAKKFMVIPADRHNLAVRKLQSQMFKEIFEKEGWGILYMEEIQALFQEKDYDETKLEEIQGLKDKYSKCTTKRIKKSNINSQIDLL